MTVFEHGVIDWNGDKRRIAVIPARAYEPYEPYPEAASEGRHRARWIACCGVVSQSGIRNRSHAFAV
jgi:hypothetical protein